MKPLKGSRVVKLTTSTALSHAAADSRAAAGCAVISASEANRSFSSLLRQVAQGQRFTVFSHGRAVATIAPAEQDKAAQGTARRALLTRLATQAATGTPRDWQRDDLYD